jgi:hypothetical protein
MKRTKSEMLFEELCKQHGIRCKQLPKADHKQPDYLLDLNGNRVIAEVKEISPNDADKQFVQDMKITGKASGILQPETLARRIRNDISKSGKQINEYLTQYPNTPGLLVLFDNTGHIPTLFTDPNLIRQAMYGWEHVILETPCKEQSHSVINCGFAERNNAEVRRDKNLQLSALVTLHEFIDIHTQKRCLSLIFYHNQYAQSPFDPMWWMGVGIEHFKLEEKQEGQFQNWVKIDDIQNR